VSGSLPIILGFSIRRCVPCHVCAVAVVQAKAPACMLLVAREQRFVVSLFFFGFAKLRVRNPGPTAPQGLLDPDRYRSCDSIIDPTRGKRVCPDRIGIGSVCKLCKHMNEFWYNNNGSFIF